MLAPSIAMVRPVVENEREEREICFIIFFFDTVHFQVEIGGNHLSFISFWYSANVQKMFCGMFFHLIFWGNYSTVANRKYICILFDVSEPSSLPK